ncbi:hypothetical protein GO986_16510 [Deinococcus sp. HMF7620]|uniref:Uncharacterized protein n=1 Tax=Deinococcus arboris TaxID=2682977 RepID=A0A7C9HT62_9DEIO|nr:hypothetical protein [Deinococcus arboris]MVN88349.1 hypothetical protein [Deinococcus arboris]
MTRARTIEDAAAGLLPPVLVACVRQRTPLGPLPDQPHLRARAVGLTRELLVSLLQALWMNEEATARRLAVEAQLVVRRHRLTFTEIVTGRVA